jgi:hypothetical protein
MQSDTARTRQQAMLENRKNELESATARHMKEFQLALYLGAKR